MPGGFPGGGAWAVLELTGTLPRMLHVMQREMEYGKREHYVRKCLMTNYGRQAIKIYYSVLYKICNMFHFSHSVPRCF